MKKENLILFGISATWITFLGVLSCRAESAPIPSPSPSMGSVSPFPVEAPTSITLSQSGSLSLPVALPTFEVTISQSDPAPELLEDLSAAPLSMNTAAAPEASLLSTQPEISLEQVLENPAETIADNFSIVSSDPSASICTATAAEPPSEIAPDGTSNNSTAIFRSSSFVAPSATSRSTDTSTMLFPSNPQCDPLANFTQLPLLARCTLSSGNVALVRQPDGSYAAGCVCRMNTTLPNGRIIVSNVPFDPNTSFCTSNGFLRGDERLGGIRNVIVELQTTLADGLVRLPSEGYLTATGLISLPGWRETRRVFLAAQVLGSACHMDRFKSPQCPANRQGYCCQDFSRCAADCLFGHGAVGTGVMDFVCPGPSGHRITTIGFWGTRDWRVDGRPAEPIRTMVNCLFEPQFSEIAGCYDIGLSAEEKQIAIARILSEYYSKKRIPDYAKCSIRNLSFQFHGADVPIFKRCCLYQKTVELGAVDEKIYWPGELGDPDTLCPQTLNGYSYAGLALCSPDTPTLPGRTTASAPPASAS